MSEAESTTEVKTVKPQALTARMGISPKRLRQILRSDYPRDTTKKRWEIPETLARKVQKDYKAKLKEKEAKKQAQVNSELEGKE